MSAEDGGVPGQVVKVVHDDGHEQVEHEEAAEEDKGDEEHVGQLVSAQLNIMVMMVVVRMIALGTLVVIMQINPNEMTTTLS